MTDTTEGMTAREAMRWYLDQPEGTEFEVASAIGPKGFIWDRHDLTSLDQVVRIIGNGWTIRIAPKPQAPERVWIDPGLIGVYYTGDVRPKDAIPYVPESTMPRGRTPDLKVLPCGEQVWDRSTGLIWTRATIAQEVDHDDALQAALKCDVGGNKWQLPTRGDLLTLVDDTRHKPAIDTEAFPDTKNDWYWSSTPTAWSASAAWIVYFDLGLAYDLDRDYHACVRAVRVATSEELRVLILGESND